MPTNNPVDTCKEHVNGTSYDIPREFAKTVTTDASGVATVYLTSDETASGTALFTNVFLPTAAAVVRDNSAIYQPGAFTLSGDNKTLTVNIKKQSFALVTVVGISVLGSTSMTNANGVSVSITVRGV